jgi:hypothetical protein
MDVMQMGGKTSSKAKNAWNAKTYDRVGLMLYKGDKEQYKQIASDAGLSLNAWIVAAMEEKRGK